MYWPSRFVESSSVRSGASWDGFSMEARPAKASGELLPTVRVPSAFPLLCIGATWTLAASGSSAEKLVPAEPLIATEECVRDPHTDVID